MKKSILERPSAYAQSPLFAILPDVGDQQHLPHAADSFFARYQRAQEALQEFNKSDDKGEAMSAQQYRKRLEAEVGMLKTLLTYLDYGMSVSE